MAPKKGPSKGSAPAHQTRNTSRPPRPPNWAEKAAGEEANRQALAQEQRKKAMQDKARAAAEERAKVQEEQDRQADEAHAAALARDVEEKRKEEATLKAIQRAQKNEREAIVVQKNSTQTNKQVRFGLTTVEPLKPVRLKWGPSNVHARVIQNQALQARTDKEQRQQGSARSVSDKEDSEDSDPEAIAERKEEDNLVANQEALFVYSVSFTLK